MSAYALNTPGPRLQTYWRHAVRLVLACVLSLIYITPSIAAGNDAAPSDPKANGSYTALADMLENEGTRQKLILQLRELAKEQTPAATAQAHDDATNSLPSQIAATTQQFAAQAARQLTEASAAIRALFEGKGAAGMSWPQWRDLLSGLLVVVVATLAAFWLLRLIAAPIYRRVDGWVDHQVRQDREARHRERAEHGHRQHPVRSSAASIGKRCLAIIGTLLIDVALVLLAVAVGYGIGLFGTGETGRLGNFESLFLNAFVMVEIAKALLRMVFATRYDNLRLFPAMSADVARYWNRWLAHLVGISGYGLLVGIPVLTYLTDQAVGLLASLIIMLGVYVYAIRVILKNRLTLKAQLNHQADKATLGVFGTLLRVLARIWHVLAIAYFTVLLVVSQVDPVNALPFMARATAQTLLAVGLGVLASAVLTALMSRRLTLPESIRNTLPMLERRINAYVPKALHGIRILLGIFVVLVVLDAWEAFDLPTWLESPQGARLVGTIVDVAVVLCIAALVWTVVASVIEHRLSGTNGREASAREQTLLSLFRNVVLILIVTMTVLIVLSQIGINIGPLIAGAGMIGLAVSFGAQTLVKDIITGVFIQLENAINTGDVVDVAGVSGVVEKVTIRSVGIRAGNGSYHIVPFSSVDKVTNHMRGFSRHMGEYMIAYREDIDNAIAEMQNAFEKLKQIEPLGSFITGDMAVPGVVELGDNGVTIRIVIQTLPGKQWDVGRMFNKLVKNQFDEAGIEMPFPQMTLHFAEAKTGEAPAANVRMLSDH